jgi:hypothetical protein
VHKPIGLRVVNSVFNPLVRGVLRSRAHRLISGSLLVIELVGARSGRAISLPVAYKQTSPTALRVRVGGSQHKLWWRNLRQKRRVTVWLKGERVAGTGLAEATDGGIDVLLKLDA